MGTWDAGAAGGQVAKPLKPNGSAPGSLHATRVLDIYAHDGKDALSGTISQFRLPKAGSCPTCKNGDWGQRSLPNDIGECR